MIELAPEAVVNYDYGSYKGYFAENFILQELVNVWSESIYNWQENTAEIEFLLSFKNKPVPVEVKAGLNTKAKSLDVFQKKYVSDVAFLFCGQSYTPSRSARKIPSFV